MITMKTMQSKKLSQDQSGLVAIIVTLIIMFVLSITVLSFATTSRRNGRQALDRQLSTQAFYAAESGINDALAVIRPKVTAGQPVTAKTTCEPGGDYSQSNILDASAGLAYTCLLVDAAPKELVYDNVSTSHSQVIPFRSSGAIDYMELKWNSSSYVSPISGCPGGVPTPPSFPSSAAWGCNASGVLRIDVVDVSGGDFKRNAVPIKTFFIYPTTAASPGIQDVAAISNGSVVAGNCLDPAPTCHFKMNLVSNRPYYLRIRAIYSSINLRITAPSAGNNQPIYGAQATIDATGKANDVLRRVQVHVPISANYDFPDYAIQSGRSICKIANLTDNLVNIEPSNAPADVSAACAP